MLVVECEQLDGVAGSEQLLLVGVLQQLREQISTAPVEKMYGSTAGGLCWLDVDDLLSLSCSV